jgi:hypothetical protein
MFTFGYRGWGNETPKLVQAVDAVEQARGFGPPVFVDVRISRSVRAVGFREKALEKLLGSDRYIWMNRLGNDAIIEGGKMRIHDPSAAADLLELARENAMKRRRVIFFCSCEVPSGCHRSRVADLVLEEARRRQVDAVIDEWPGGEPRVHDVRLSKESISQRIGGRASLPFTRVQNLAEIAGLPWGSAVKVTAPGEYTFLTSGPAIVVRGKWALPIYFPNLESAEEALAAGAELRTERGVGQRKP